MAIVAMHIYAVTLLDGWADIEDRKCHRQEAFANLLPSAVSGFVLSIVAKSLHRSSGTLGCTHAREELLQELEMKNSVLRSRQGGRWRVFKTCVIGVTK